MNDRSTKIEPTTEFKPSLATKMLSFLVAPKQISGMVGAGAAALAGCSAPVSLVAAGTMITAHTLITKILSGGNTLRSATFIQAEHLSRLDIQGGLPFITLPLVIHALENIRTQNAIAAKSALKNLATYENYFDYLGIVNYFLINDLLDKIKKLEPFQITAISLSCMSIDRNCHIVIGSIERQKNNSYILRFHNGGDGAQEFHYSRVEKETGRKIYQTTLEIADISFTELGKFIKSAASFNAFRISNTTQKIYRLIPSLKGKVLPPSDKSQHWMRLQSGNSCSGYAIKCFLKFYLSPDEYHQFTISFLKLSVKNLQTELRENNWFFHKTKEHYLAYDELSAKLNRLQKIAPDTKPNIKPSSLANAASRIQTRFWGTFFPMSFGMGAALKLGLDSYSFRAVGELNKFKQLDKAFTQMDIDPNCMTSKTHFRNLLDDFYNTIDWNSLNKESVDKLRNIKKNLLLCIDKQGPNRTGNIFLEEFYSIVFSIYTKELNEPLANNLMIIIHHLKNGDFAQARTALINSYSKYSKLSYHLSESQKDEFQFTMCKTLYLPESIKLDDIDLRAGLAILFLNMKLDLPGYLMKNLELHRAWRLDKSFTDSPWAGAVKKGSNLNC